MAAVTVCSYFQVQENKKKIMSKAKCCFKLLDLGIMHHVTIVTGTGFKAL